MVKKVVVYIIFNLLIIWTVYGQNQKIIFDNALTNFLNHCDNLNNLELGKYINILKMFSSQKNNYETLADDAFIYYVNDFMLMVDCLYGSELKSSGGLKVQYAFSLYAVNTQSNPILHLYIMPQEEHQEVNKNHNKTIPNFLVILFQGDKYKRYYLFIEDDKIICRN